MWLLNHQEVRDIFHSGYKDKGINISKNRFRMLVWVFFNCIIEFHAIIIVLGWNSNPL